VSSAGRLWLGAALAFITGDGGSAQATIPLAAGMVITRSVTIEPGAYILPAAADLKTPAVTIRGDNITVDFNGASLAGTREGQDPDTFAGVGILIDGGSKVTVKNAIVRRYRVGILARRSPGLHLTGNDVSHNWKQRLYSGIEKESLVDWMSYHQNEQDEWLRYGAGIYVSESDGAEIDRNTAVQGQNGLLVTKSSRLKIWNNTFQFLSSIGVGLYRVTDSTIVHNRIDWCVRGYSHGFYNRGQDSAGLLMYEQSSRNRVAFNSITHGGDGLFLWAGQSTMDTGQGGSNENVFFRNDFSHAPTNGIEATFSSNIFHENRVEECWHGVWGGYSYKSEWVLNRFARNTEAIAIEHGQQNVIARNTFDGDETAIRLWQNATQDPNWGYPKHRDTQSAGYVISGNTFRNNKTALQVRDTKDVKTIANTYVAVATTLSLGGVTPNLLVDPPGIVPRAGDMRLVGMITPLPGGIDPMIKDGERRGRHTIIVDEWGPYDWKSPKLWPVAKPDEHPLRLRVLGPAGEWKVASVAGATVTPQSGSVPGEISVAPGFSPASRDQIVDFMLTLEYRGGAVTSPRGERTPAGSPYRFSYSRFFVAIPWHVKFFEYGDAADPVKQPKAFATLLEGSPIKDIRTDRLDYISGRTIEDGVPRDRFALVAEGSATLPAGDYVLQVISDDGVRVWVDGELLIDEWQAHESKVTRAPIGGGSRRFKVQYYEVGGFAELRFDILKR
jgi:parallel beta-helix repeat protein